MSKKKNLMVRSLVTETEGYSLAELMVVLVILGILALIAIPQFMGLPAMGAKKRSAVAR